MNISRKLSVWTLASLLVIGTLSLYYHSQLLIEAETEEFVSSANILGPIIEESLTQSMLTRDEHILKKTIKKLEGVDPISRVMLVNAKGEVKEGTAPEGEGKLISFVDEPYLKYGDSDRARSGIIKKKNYFRWLQFVRNRPECYQCHSPQIRNNGAIVIDFSTDTLKKKVRTHIEKESLIFLGSFTGVALVMFFISNSLVITRLKKITDSMRKLQSGDYITRLSVPGNDEIAKLAEGFNEMAESIAEGQRELKTYADELLALAVSTNVVTAVPRTENIYEAICHITVRELKLKMAWIGLLSKGSHDVVPAAHYGFENGYLSNVKITWDDSRSGMGPTGMAIKTKTPQMINDMESDPAYASWRYAAAKCGYRASMALPLLSSDGDVLGVLNLYSCEPAYFSRKRIRIFMVFANQAAAAIENRLLLENVEESRGELSEQLKVISQSQKEWQLTFDGITDLVSIHDQDFRIIKANKALMEHSGLTQPEIINRKCYDVFHDTCSPVVNCPHRVSMLEKRSVTEEVRDPRTGKLFRVSTFPYYSPEEEFIGSVHIAKDITEEKETEMRLIMSERLAALGQMASGLAHEINTPLASIAGCAEGLLRKVKNNRYDPKLFEEYLQIVEEEIQRCKSITTGMLSFVRTATYEKRDVRINEALDKALEIIGFQGRLRDIESVRNYQTDIPVIRGSEGELRQVFLVIISNALDAMDNSGTLTLETGVDKESVFVKITDSGPGIKQELFNRIFDPFFTTKSDKGGTGLGLSIAHKIIANHGGILDVASQEGKSATFTITLPLS